MTPSPRSVDAVWDVITGVIIEVLPTVSAEQVRPDRSLVDLGADSLERVEIIVALKEAFGVHEPLSRFDVPDLRALAEIFALAAPR